MKKAERQRKGHERKPPQEDLCGRSQNALIKVSRGADRDSNFTQNILVVSPEWKCLAEAGGAVCVSLY